MSTHPHDSELPRYARAVIAAAVGGPEVQRPQDPSLKRTAAAFVTLRWPDGSLQGCIGTIEPRGSLLDAVTDGAKSAAFRDPRGRNFTLDEVNDLFVEVSVLSPTERVSFTSEETARAALRPGIDGVVLRYHDKQGTFLPQMWPRLGSAENFLNELKRKAGLSSRFWSPEVELRRYTVEAYTDGIEPPGEE